MNGRNELNHITLHMEIDASSGEQEKPRIQSVARALTILTEIAKSGDGLTAKDLSRQLNLRRQTTYHLLHTLREAGFVAKGRENRYELGLSVGTLSEAFGQQLSPPTHLLSLARSIAMKSGEATYIAGWHRREVTVMSHFPGKHTVRVGDLRIGIVGDAHARASGKALLAFSSPEQRESYLATHPVDRRTENTIVDRDQLEQEFELTRERGYALDLEEFDEGICCISVPINGGDSPFVVSVAAPKQRFLDLGDEYIAMMLDEVRGMTYASEAAGP